MTKPLYTFSFFRVKGLIIKEFTQFIRDHTTFALVIGIPIIQLILFGLAINTNPKSLPSALLNYDNGPFSRTLIHEMENTQYFKFDHIPPSEANANELMATHQVLFTLSIPADFSRQLVKGKFPAALLEVDGTDPVSVASAMAASTTLMTNIFQHDLVGPLAFLKGLRLMFII